MFSQNKDATISLTEPVRKIIVLGGGSAGFIAAINVKVKNPDIEIAVVRSADIGIIRVGESTIHTVPKYLHHYLGIDPAEFFREVDPTWKLGIRFLWGPRERFHYTFRVQVALHYEYLPNEHLPMPMGFYYGDNFEDGELMSSLCSSDGVFARRADGTPIVGRDWAYHLDNKKLVAFLERYARKLGVGVIDDLVEGVVQDESGVTALRLKQGGVTEADFFIDCSGFRSLLIGQALEQTFVSFKSSLFCDRAIVGEWQRRADEPIQPYTTAETMQAGWCWQIDHEKHISRGYVYSSDFISDDDAEREFRSKNPQIGDTYVVRFVSGRYRDAWVKNVVAIGNSNGFVEPLESTALYVLCQDAKAVAESFRDARGAPTPSMRDAFNRRSEQVWDVIRRFLSIHYKFNTRIDSPFWRACQSDVDLCGAAPIVEYYRENGPSRLWHETLTPEYDMFGLDGYYTMLLGQNVPYQRVYEPSETELQVVNMIKRNHQQLARNALNSEEALALVRSAGWQWPADAFRP